MKPLRPLLLPLIAAALAAGCFGITHRPYAGPTARPAPAPTAAPAHSAGNRIQPPGDLELRPAGRTLGYDRFDLEFASSGDNLQPDGRVRARWFRRPGSDVRPAVVVLPIWGRSGYPPRVTVRHILRRGELDVVRVTGRHPVSDWQGMRTAATPAAFDLALQRTAGALGATVVDLRRLVDWLAERPEIDDERLAVVGFSVSAVLGALVMGLEPELARGVLVMGGGRFDQIFKHCEKRAGRVRETVRHRFGWSAEEFRRRVAPELAPFDPILAAHRVDPAGVLYIDAAADNCIPEPAREDLWRALGSPERLQTAARHRRSFLAMTPLRAHRLTREITAFLHRPWRPGEPPRASR